jgi:hypothetical protein
MRKYAIAFPVVMTLFAGCKSSPDKPAGPAVVEAAAPAEYSEPPSFDAGIGVEQAYAAIPHRRTVWVEDGSVVPAAEKAYLKAMFRVLDQAVAVRVATMQDFSNGRFEHIDTDAEYDLLVKYVRGMSVPPNLAIYHKHILVALDGEQYFFRQWRMQGEKFWDTQKAGNYPGARGASAELKAAYGELMAKYPGESARNKDAFFDYHCALDFL